MSQSSRRRPLFLLPLLALVLVSTAGRAATIGFSGTMGGAALTLTNTSTSASITQVKITIGDTAYNFDSVNLAGDATVLQPDHMNGLVRSDLTDVTFTSFGAAEIRNFPWDIDPDTGDDSCCGVSGVLINNGAAPNAVMTVYFSTGQQLVYELPDSQADYDDPTVNPSACPSSPSCVFAGASAQVPEPALGALLASALALGGGLAQLARRAL